MTHLSASYVSTHPSTHALSFRCGARRGFQCLGALLCYLLYLGNYEYDPCKDDVSSIFSLYFA